MELNKWILDITYWCPAQIYYYFEDAAGGRWCIYLRWRHQDPWTAELVRCDENWDFVWECPDNMILLENEPRIPGKQMGYYRAQEYSNLMERVLEIVKPRIPELN